MLSNYKVCDNGNVIKWRNFQNNYGTVAQMKVSSYACIFKFLDGPPRFSPMGKFIPKISICDDFGIRKPIFLKQR